MTILGILPDMVEPDLVIELDAITAMKAGTVAGGPELFPGSVVHVPPQVGGAVLVVSAKPLKAAGAGPPLSELTFAHCAPQKVTALPTVASTLPITKEPLLRKAKGGRSVIFATKASEVPPPKVLLKAPGVVGKLAESVPPVT